MANKKNTRRALLTSVLSLILCVSMFVGTTFAWFTDTVTSGVNTIQSGNLDVELEYYANGAWNKVTETTNVFEADTLWEPGHTEVVYLKASNMGSLALTYKLGVHVAHEEGSINKAGEAFKLSEYLKMGAVAGVSTPYANRAAARDALDATAVKALNAGYSQEGVLYAANDVPAGGKTEDYVALVVYMPEEVGNEANHQTGVAAPKILLGINLFATQQMHEEDSFGKDYDEDAKEQVNAFGTAYVNDNGSTYIEGRTPTSNGAVHIAATVPADAIDNVDTLTIKVEPDGLYDGITVASDQAAETFDVTVNGLKAGNTTPIKVEMYIGKDQTNVKLYHYGTEIAYDSYSPSTGYVIFETTTFSPFTVVYDAIPGVIPSVPVPDLSTAPTATVTPGTHDHDDAIVWSSFGGVPKANDWQTLESTYVFTCPDDSTSVETSPFKDWNCDFFVSVDKAVKAGDIFLGGNYGDFGWVGFESPIDVAAGEEVPLLGSVSGAPWTYEMIVDWVGTFTCGVSRTMNEQGEFIDNGAMDGVTFTVKLRLTHPEDSSIYKDVNTITYTFN